MKPKPTLSRLIILLALGLSVPGAVVASGTYTARPPKPITPDQARKLDSAKYDLGKRLYNGKVPLVATPAPAQAEARLAALQGQLPPREQKKVQLPALSGKLNAEQLDALEYYVQQRFPRK